MADDFEMNNVFRGDFIVAQTEVIFFKRKKKKKKQPTPQRCILLITSDTVALTDPHKDGKPVLMFPRNTITDFRYNDNTDTHFDQYKLEISVWIKDKTHELCIEFPTEDAKRQRDTFIEHFTADKAKPIERDHNDHNTIAAPPPSKTTIQPQPQSQPSSAVKPQHARASVAVTKAPPQPSPPIRRGVKRKHESIMNEDTLRQRACKLAKHKYLATLYKTLVGKNVLSPNEFWKEYGKDIDIKHTSNGLIQGLPNTVLSSTMHRDTWSLFSLFKDDIDNQQNEDNKGKLTIHLTAENILEIFLHLPEVKLAYQRHVPCHFSEDEFWKAFLQSHYFKRGTTRNVTSGISDKETQIDKLLKTYIVQLQQEKNQMNDLKSASTDGGVHTHAQRKRNEINSFAKQLEAIQLAKNKEVDVQGKLKQMREDIAAARAAKQGGDMHKFVQAINDGEIRTNAKEEAEIKDTDVEMKDNNNNHNKHSTAVEQEHERPSSTEHFKKKLHTLDPSIDLSATMDSFTEIIEDPGTDENIRRDDIETWMTQINKHGSMLLYQSLNQTNPYDDNTGAHSSKRQSKQDIHQIMSNVPKVNYGREYKTDLVFGDDANNDDDDRSNNNNNNNMRYEDRLHMETELDDLKRQRAAKCIELKIKDQSVYWGDDLLLTQREQMRMNQEANELNGYFTKVAEKKKSISGQQVTSLIPNKFVVKTIMGNTTNNAATGNAKLASHRISENKKRNEHTSEKEELMIYGQEQDFIANTRILSQLTVFQKPMTELVRHYWNCFPANKQRLEKSETLVDNLKAYKAKLVGYTKALAKKKQDFQVQTVLLQELIGLADKVLQHHQNLKKTLVQKDANRKKQVSEQ